MPIMLPRSLPAFDVLKREGVVVMDENAAARQDIRPLRIVLLNLMPHKEKTEAQFARLIGAGPLQIDLHLMRISDHRSRHTGSDHMDAFYRSFNDVAASGEKFDGFIITGAPLETFAFEDVTYWDELRRIFDWSRTHIHSSFAVCWGAMAMINHMHGVPKHGLDTKAFGCYRHAIEHPANRFMRGFSDDFIVPVSRWTEIRRDDLDKVDALQSLLHSEEVGPCLIEDRESRTLFMFNHLEYDTNSLAEEYSRDQAAGNDPAIPVGYFPDDDPSATPVNRWRGHAHLLFGNWINELYATTPFVLDEIGAANTDLRG